MQPGGLDELQNTMLMLYRIFHRQNQTLKFERLFGTNMSTFGYQNEAFLHPTSAPKSTQNSDLEKIVSDGAGRDGAFMQRDAAGRRQGRGRLRVRKFLEIVEKMQMSSTRPAHRRCAADANGLRHCRRPPRLKIVNSPSHGRTASQNP